MIQFIDEHKDQFGVEFICRVLKSAVRGGFLTSRGYRAARTRPLSDRQVRDEILTPVVRELHEKHFGVYGRRKMHALLRREGWDIGRDQTARLMRLAGVQGLRRGRKTFTTKSDPQSVLPHDLVNRDFTAERPSSLWLVDITYVRTTNGFCYTAFITDVFSRRIVGWSTRSTMRTEDLPLEALQHALVSAKDQALSGLVHHRDRGSQYVSIRYTENLADHGIAASVGSRGDSFDNALAETVNGLYKTELIHARPAWPTVTEVEFETLKWVHWWNNTRIHQGLDYQTPNEYETIYYETRERALAHA